MRPSHYIYSVGLGRYVTAEELLAAQGIWRIDSENVAAFDAMTSVPKFAHDIAGNAFSSTACQAAFLTSLVVCDAWRDVQPATPSSIARHDVPNPQSVSSVPCSSERVDKSCAQEMDPVESTHVAIPKHDKQKKRAASPPQIPTRRLRKKTSLAVTKAKQKGVRGVGAGNRQGKGKSKMASIYEKEALMSAYDDAVQKGNPYPIKVVRNMRGYFNGCVYDSTWGKIRKEQKWTLLCTTAPELMKKHHEVPNCIRRIMHIKTMKHAITKMGDGSDQQLEQIHMPLPLQMVVEDVVMDRICHGEEMNMQSVKSILVFCTELWNSVTASMRDTIQDKALDIIRSRDAELAQCSSEELTQKVKAVIQSALDLLRPIRIAANDATLLWLVEIVSALCFG